MSKIIIWGEDENEREKVILWKKNECKWKINGICSNNSDWKKLGKKCHECNRKETEEE